MKKKILIACDILGHDAHTVVTGLNGIEDLLKSL